VTITRGGTPQSSDPLGNHWTFTGRFLDEEAGLLYYRARYYDPATGRFLQRDPLGYFQGPHLFEYVATRPTNDADPAWPGLPWYNDAPDGWEWFAWLFKSGRTRGRGAPAPPPPPQPWWKKECGGGVGVNQKKERLERVIEQLKRTIWLMKRDLRPPDKPVPIATVGGAETPPEESGVVRYMRHYLRFAESALADAEWAYNSPKEPTPDEITEIEYKAEGAKENHRNGFFPRD
jgi:RHS repeat-associated protein